MSDGFKSATFDDASNATEAIELAGSNRIIVVNEACQGERSPLRCQHSNRWRHWSEVRRSNSGGSRFNGSNSVTSHAPVSPSLTQVPRHPQLRGYVVVLSRMLLPPES